MNEVVQRMMLKAQMGKRLLENEDVVKFFKELEEEWAELIRKLRTTATTDPKIAEIQGRLNTLESVYSRPEKWLIEAQQAKKYAGGERVEEGDYSHG